MKQGERERLEEYDRQLGQRLGQEEGDRYHPTTRHPTRHGRRRQGRRRHWFRGAVHAMWYLLLAAAAVSAVYHLLLAS